MYPAPIYSETDPAFAIAVTREHAFACLTSITGGGLKATHAPLTPRSNEGPHGMLYGHLASDNPQCASFDAQHEALAVFNGPHAYISPLWVREPAREASTWDYISVRASARPSSVCDLSKALLSPHTWRGSCGN